MARRPSGAANCRRRRESRKPSAPLGSAPARVWPELRGLRTPAELLCCHLARLGLRLVQLPRKRHRGVSSDSALPEVCDVAKVFLDPLVGIDGVKVAFAAVVKNRHARRASG